LDYINYDKSIFGTISHSKNRKYSYIFPKSTAYKSTSQNKCEKTIFVGIKTKKESKQIDKNKND